MSPSAERPIFLAVLAAILCVASNVPASGHAGSVQSPTGESGAATVDVTPLRTVPATTLHRLAPLRSVSTIFPGVQRAVGAQAEAPAHGLLSSASSVITVGNGTFNWSDATSTTGSPFSASDLVFTTEDPADGYLLAVVYNQTSGGGPWSTQTWCICSGVWKELTPAQEPGPHSYPSLAWDAADGYVVLFGGADFVSNAYYNDSWAFSKGNWTHLVTPRAPSPRYMAAMTYDPSLSALVLVGGYDGNILGDEWKYSAGNWTPLSTNSPSPGPRYGEGLAFDNSTDQMILFGGLGNTSSNSDGWGTLNDTWSLDGTNWTLLVTPLPPASRWGLGMAYEPEVEGVVLFGGSGWIGGFPGNVWDDYNSTWLWQHDRWINVSRTVGPGPQYYSNLAFAPDLDRLVSCYPPSANTGTQQTWQVSLSDLLTATASVGAGDAPLSVNLTSNFATSHPPYLFAWSLGDGSTSISQNLTHVYSAAGLYVVNLTASDHLGVTSSVSLEIAVNAELRVAASTNVNEGLVPLTVGFSARSTGGTLPVNFTWNFGDGNTSSGPSATHVYAAIGNYNASITVTDAAGSRVAQNFTIRAYSLLDLSLTNPAQYGEVPFTAHLTAALSGGEAPETLFWQFGDGASWTGSNVSHTYVSPGDYLVNCTAEDSIGSKVTESEQVQVDSDVAASVTSPVDYGLAPFTFALRAGADGGAPPYNYTWNFGDGVDGSGEDGTHTYTTPGSYNATVTIVDAWGYGSMASTAIDLAPQLGVAASARSPNGTLPLTVQFSAMGSGGFGPLSYRWAFGDGATSAAENTSHTYVLPGNFTAKLTMADSRGNELTKVFEVEVLNSSSSSPPPAAPSGGTLPYWTIPVGIAAVLAVVIAIYLVRRRYSPHGPPEAGESE